VSRTDATTERLKSLACHWRDIDGNADEQVDDLIREDGIDILIDLAGHTARNRLLLFARKPAPVQITYLGYPGTTGLSTMDYRLSDEFADPSGMTEQFHTEELLRLPESFLCFAPPEENGAVEVLPARKKGYVTFGCFNVLGKINGPLVGWWCKILRGVAESTLMLKTGGLLDNSVAQRILGMFQAGGIGRERVDLRGWSKSREEHLGFYGQIDIALDTFPYHGTTITCEALWMGVPVITLAGRTHVSRVGVSLLNNAGLKKWIAQTPEEYVALAIEKAGNLAGLSRTRSGLRKKMSGSALTDGKKFAGQVEAVYRKVWQDWCKR
jgi:predicted O-linked N-acetylglucosamine transferase (SPINDLY family)